MLILVDLKHQNELWNPELVSSSSFEMMWKKFLKWSDLNGILGIWGVRKREKFYFQNMRRCFWRRGNVTWGTWKCACRNMGTCEEHLERCKLVDSWIWELKIGGNTPQYYLIPHFLPPFSWLLSSPSFGFQVNNTYNQLWVHLYQNTLFRINFFFDSDNYPRVNQSLQIFTREMRIACATRLISKSPQEP